LLFCFLALPAAAQTKKPPPAKPLDLNSATLEQLQTLPTIGPATAKAIVRFREKSGPFRRVEDLLAIRGFTKRRLEKIRPYVTVNPSAPPSSSRECCHPERSEGSLSLRVSPRIQQHL
jgi:competence protein ComEA